MCASPVLLGPEPRRLRVPELVVLPIGGRGGGVLRGRTHGQAAARVAVVLPALGQAQDCLHEAAVAALHTGIHGMVCV